MESKPIIIDTHCHLDYIARQIDEADAESSVPSDAVEAVMIRAKEAGVGWLVNPGVTPDRFEDIIALTVRFDNVYAALAVHPTDVDDIANSPQWVDTLAERLKHPKVVAIGETGLDYYRDEQKQPEQVALQKHCFRTLLELGRERDLPVIIHDREAHDDILSIVSEYPGVRGIMHCFSGDTVFARKMIERGFFISFAGNLTFKNAGNLHEAAKELPLEHLLTETDSPFLSPVPFRGKPNEPSRVQFVVEKIAELKKCSYEEIAAVTTANASKVFGIPVH
jgi:TatD DNase family protein